MSLRQPAEAFAVVSDVLVHVVHRQASGQPGFFGDWEKFWAPENAVAPH
jgi:hypothetical protein